MTTILRQLRLASASLGTALLLCAASAAATPTLLVDIDALPTSAVLSPTEPVRIDDVVYFAGSDPTNGRELWRTDGTAAGTHVVRDARIGADSLDPRFLTDAAGTLYFSGIQESLWKSDGTAEGTVEVWSNPAPAPIVAIRAAGDRVYFVSGADGSSTQLWTTDGTRLGTLSVATLDPSLGNGAELVTAAANDRFFFLIQDGRQQGLWTSDGTDAGTRLLAPGHVDPALIPFGNGLIYAREDPLDDWVLERTDGSADAPVRLASLAAGAPVKSILLSITSDVQAFLATLGDDDRWTLWRTDGTDAGTIALDTYASMSPPRELVVHNGRAYAVLPGDDEASLLVSDGTVAGTGLAGNLPASAANVSFLGPRVFFTSELKLWSFRGFNASEPVRQLVGRPGGALSVFASINGVLVLSADGAVGRSDALWRSDGTDGGTSLLRATTASSFQHFLGRIDSTQLFVADDGTHGAELWKSDGTAQGTMLVKDIHAGAAGSNPQFAAEAGQFLYFSADDGEHGAELWKTDGTENGTRLVLDLRGGTVSSAPGPVAATPTQAFFVATTAGDRVQLFRTDGTVDGTLPVTPPVSAADSPGSLTVVGDTLFFLRGDARHGRELWSSDGTLAGTQLVDGGDALIFFLANVEGTLHFGRRGSDAFELWSSDGTAAGTALLRLLGTTLNEGDVRHLGLVGKTHFFGVLDGNGQVAVQRTDGTESGTAWIAELGQGASALPYGLGSGTNRLFFASLSAAGADVWSSDGTAKGTRSLGTFAGPPQGPFTETAPGVYFHAGRGLDDGLEPWLSNGTPEGTGRWLDLAPGAASSLAIGAAASVAGDRLYFAADDGRTGTELWSIDVDQLIPNPPAQQDCDCAGAGSFAAALPVGLLLLGLRRRRA